MADPTPIKTVEVDDYDPKWADEFESYAGQLHTTLGDLVMSIEHVGSTSVVGLAAKPLVDIDVVISSRILLEKVIERLAALGYVHEGN
ncbi:MAG: GrpB family protein [Chloroflexota bacterium]